MTATQDTKNRTESEINNELSELKIKWTEYNKGLNEGAKDGYNPFDVRIQELSDELYDVRKANSPLTLDLAGEKAAFNAQGFTGRDLAKANEWCLSRGYSLADLQASAR